MRLSGWPAGFSDWGRFNPNGSCYGQEGCQAEGVPVVKVGKRAWACEDCWAKFCDEKGLARETCRAARAATETSSSGLTLKVNRASYGRLAAPPVPQQRLLSFPPGPKKRSFTMMGLKPCAKGPRLGICADKDKCKKQPQSISEDLDKKLAKGLAACSAQMQSEMKTAHHWDEELHQCLQEQRDNKNHIDEVIRDMPDSHCGANTQPACKHPRCVFRAHPLRDLFHGFCCTGCLNRLVQFPELRSPVAIHGQRCLSRTHPARNHYWDEAHYALGSVG
jgi:hypothetical protein